MLDFEESIKLKEIGKDTFQNIHEPWTWPGSPVVPGGLLISECAAATYTTVDLSKYVLDNLQSQFLSRTDPKVPIIYTVQRLSSGRRFAVRFVTASQGKRNIICATICFAGLESKEGSNAMRYTVKRETPYEIADIILDDLEPKTPLGPFMKFQRLPLHKIESSRTSSEVPQLTNIATSACHLSSSLAHHPLGHPVHTLGILNLSDYHVLDCPLTLAGIPFGLFAIGDTSRTPTSNEVVMYTSLNHNIWFYRHDGFRADEMCYVEGRSTWANGDGRAGVETFMFGRDGMLIARVVQEAFYVLKDNQSQSTVAAASESKL